MSVGWFFMFCFKKLIMCCVLFLFIGFNGCSNIGILFEVIIWFLLIINVNDY